MHERTPGTGRITRLDGRSASVSGMFYRAVEPRFRASALSGSRAAGRYSRPGVPALYLSSSEEGVAAAMLAHTDATSPVRQLLRFRVDADGIVDLRDPAALRQLGIDPADAAAPWRPALERGDEPRSWSVRDRLEAHGANGLIDPSRKRPGLWHLTLFRWNSPGAPVVEEAPSG